MLFKYCNLSGINILRKRKLKAAKLNDLNDPFDLVYGIDEERATDNLRREFPHLKERWMEHLDSVGASYNRNSPEDIWETLYLIECLRVIFGILQTCDFLMVKNSSATWNRSIQ